MLPGFCSRGHIVLKKLIKEFKDGFLMNGHRLYPNGMI